ncbi:MAG TPA: hypothetical protein VK996_08900 [Ramlibacter sp.]|nr:hypothetical protein [Ramlibacter sp.]
MLVHRAEISASERQDFEQAIRDCGKDPCAFKAELFETTLAELGRTLRRVHVVTAKAAAQYDASGGTSWTLNFARHLAQGVYG